MSLVHIKKLGAIERAFLIALDVGATSLREEKCDVSATWWRNTLFDCATEGLFRGIMERIEGKVTCATGGDDSHSTVTIGLTSGLSIQVHLNISSSLSDTDISAMSDWRDGRLIEPLIHADTVAIYHLTPGNLTGLNSKYPIDRANGDMAGGASRSITAGITNFSANYLYYAVVAEGTASETAYFLETDARGELFDATPIYRLSSGFERALFDAFQRSFVYGLMRNNSLASATIRQLLNNMKAGSNYVNMVRAWMCYVFDSLVRGDPVIVLTQQDPDWGAYRDAIKELSEIYSHLNTAVVIPSASGYFKAGVSRKRTQHEVETINLHWLKTHDSRWQWISACDIVALDRLLSAGQPTMDRFLEESIQKRDAWVGSALNQFSSWEPRKECTPLNADRGAVLEGFPCVKVGKLVNTSDAGGLVWGKEGSKVEPPYVPRMGTKSDDDSVITGLPFYTPAVWHFVEGV